MFIRSNDLVLASEECREALISSIKPLRLSTCQRALILLDHRLSSCLGRSGSQASLFLLASSIVEHAKAPLGRDRFKSLQHFVLQLVGVKKCAVTVLKSESRAGMSRFLGQLLNEHDEQDKALVAEQSTFWLQSILQHGLVGDKAATALLWIRYMSSSQMWKFVDFLSSGHVPADASLAKDIVALLLSQLPDALQNLEDAHGVNQLVKLQSVLPDSSALEPIISLALRSQLPPVYPSGLTQEDAPSITAALAFTRSRNRQRRSRSTGVVDISQFLSAASWTSHTRQIVVDVIYLQPTVRPQVLAWIQKSEKNVSADHLAGILLALVDSSSAPEELVGDGNQFLLSACAKLLEAVKSRSHWQTQRSSAACICQIIRDLPSVRAEVLSLVSKDFRSFKRVALTAPILDITVAVQRYCGVAAEGTVETVLDHSWTWAVDAFSQEEVSIDSYQMLEAISVLITGASNIKAHLVEPVIAVALQNHLSNQRIIDFVHKLVRMVSLKPATVNKQLQTMVQHPKLYEVCGSSVSHPQARSSIISLLHTVFHSHPNNTCQPSHIAPLITLYGGTLSAFDRTLLSILRLYETTRKVSVASFLKARGSAGDTQALNAIQLLDPNTMFRTCVSYPQWRKLDGHADESSLPVIDDTLYDPIYVLLLFAQLLAESTSSSALVWVQMFRTNIVSLILRALSSDDGPIRALALSQLAGLRKAMQDSDMVEQPHVLHILNLLKDQYRPSPLPSSSTSEDHPDRLPTYTTLHLSHSLRGIFYPSQFTYPLTARYLLQRPELDTTDVPMLYGTLYSADDQWKRDRAWMVRFLADGMVGKREWKVLRRRHTWDLVASVVQGTGEKAVRQAALKLLANITSMPFTITQLVLKSSLVVWIETQLESLRPGEDIAWLKILENILVLADTGKLDAATNGEWRVAIGRCLAVILGQQSMPIETLFRALQILLRLSNLNPHSTQHPSLISAAFTHLISTEPSLTSGQITLPPTPPTLPPHSGQDLFRPPSEEHSTWWYGQCVEALWRVSMGLGLKDTSEHWESLTRKVLVWRAYAAAETTPLGEWVRKETVRSLACA
ncbi:hypothetical protein EIP91_009189 [Steccherinum ochraceum]|uniref:URB1 C-terminal domain-containing protein n=1 Tax=Steccherinum ochraceum TaxID=92696 RepID=A0A4R0R1X5_9APHY|nr:hypothetical protein EIP91_009189 [Steccherinum ochraceum]